MPVRKKQQEQAKQETQPDPDSLVRTAAGSYRTGDSRFLVQQSQATWFLLDTEQTNELGQELMHGPFPTLKAAREAIPGARSTTPLPRRPARSSRRPAAGTPARKPMPPPSWIDELPTLEAADVRRAIRALEREGIEDAEALVRRDRELGQPLVAARLIERRIGAAIEEAGDGATGVRALAARLVQIVTGDDAPAHPLPGWALVELARDGTDPGARRIRPRV